MRGFLVKICTFVLCIALIFSLTSCHKQTNDNQFQEGVEYGMEEMFLRIYNSTGFENEKILSYGDVWNTKHFSLSIRDTITKSEAYISYNLTLKTTTVGQCLELEDFFFNIYAVSDTEGMILMNDDFIWHSVLDYEGSTDEYLQGNKVKGRCKLLDNSESQTLIIIIATGGYLYTATYYT